ncbi:MAG TPA: choice-of-anchor P family protein, partial [Acidimicrobiales bacterium]|nr:choice-of-anchor P family protein [Acidimicrobiales bacterium]
MARGPRSVAGAAPIARRGVAVAAIVLATFVPTPAAGADVVLVNGGAFGFSASLSLFGGPAIPKGPAPVVTLPPTGTERPLTASEPSGHAVFGPVDMVDSGPLKVSTAGTLGPGGRVTSSSSVDGNYKPDRGPLRFELAESACTASEEGVTGVTTMTRAFVQTKLDPKTEAPLATVPILPTPAPNYTVEGTLDNIGDRFKFVFNEQILAEDGSITVNAIHMYALGPIAVGELVQAQSRCGAVGPNGPRTPTVLAAPPMP